MHFISNHSFWRIFTIPMIENKMIELLCKLEKVPLYQWHIDTMIYVQKYKNTVFFSSSSGATQHVVCTML